LPPRSEPEYTLSVFSMSLELEGERSEGLTCGHQRRLTPNVRTATSVTDSNRSRVQNPSRESIAPVTPRCGHTKAIEYASKDFPAADQMAFLFLRQREPAADATSAF
jgi:hypothetical protein